MNQTTYYTVLTRRSSFIVKYATTPACQVFTDPRMFDDPGEASQEFKKAMQGKVEQLSEGMFERKVSALSSRYQQDLFRLQSWVDGKGVSV
jgi:hypothetical protein